MTQQLTVAFESAAPYHDEYPESMTTSVTFRRLRAEPDGLWSPWVQVR